MFFDIAAILILALTLAMPVLGYIIDRWGFEEADHHAVYDPRHID